MSKKENLRKLMEEHYRYINNYLMNYKNDLNRKAYILNYGSIPTYMAIKGEYSDPGQVYGVSNEISAEFICDLILEDKIFDSESTFNNFFDESKFNKYWNWGKRENNVFFQRENIDSNLLGKALLARCILSIANFFYLEYNFDLKNNELVKLKNICNVNKIYYKCSDEKKIFLFRGVLTKKQRKGILKYFVLKEENEKVIIKVRKNNNENESVFKYSNIKCSSKYLYNGIDTTTLSHVNRINNSLANNDIITMNIKVEATSYFTFMGIGSTNLYSESNLVYKDITINEHRLLKKYKEMLLDFDNNEYSLQNELFKNLSMKNNEENQNEIFINNYLDASLYPHIEKCNRNRRKF